MSRRHEQAQLDAALADSFPASDPPAMTSLAPPTPDRGAGPAQSESIDAEVTFLYRVVSALEAVTAFMAQPPYHAGRWTSDGTPALYVSLSAGAALLEKLVHLEDGASDSLVLAIGSMPSEALVQDIPLPPDWHAFPHREAVQRAGDAWLKDHRQLGVRVPSAVIPAESNVILDVEHVEFARVKLLEIQPLKLDCRLR